MTGLKENDRTHPIDIYAVKFVHIDEQEVKDDNNQ